MTQIVYVLFYTLSLLPFRILYGMADIGYVLLYYIIRYRRGVVRKNLVTAFPEKSIDDIKTIERKFYHWFCDYFLEAIKLLSISEKELRRRFTIINSEEVEQCFQEGQDVAAILGHYCNWEWLSCVGMNLPPERETGLIYHPLRNKTFDYLSANYGRTNETVTSFPRKTSCAMLLRKREKACAIYADTLATRGRSGPIFTSGYHSSITNIRPCLQVASALCER